MKSKTEHENECASFKNSDRAEAPQIRLIGRILSAILTSVAANCGVVWLVSPWLDDSIIHPLGLGDSLEMTVSALIYMITFIIFLIVTLCQFFQVEISNISRIMRSQNRLTENEPIKRKTILDEIYQTGPYLALLNQQLDEAIKDTETAVIAVIECLNQVHHLSSSQVNHISESMRNVTQLADVGNEQHSHKRANLDISLMEDSFIESGGSLLLEAITALDVGNTEVIKRLSEALSYLQFQDVLRQRVEQVQSAISELDEHFLELANHYKDPVWNGQLSLSLKQRMGNHLDQYVMNSQRDAYALVTGNIQSEDDDRPKIELF